MTKKMPHTIVPSRWPEWQAASRFAHLFAANNLWNIVAPTDAAMVRLQVRHYGWGYLDEFRCAIGSPSGHWIPLARFTFKIDFVIEYGRVIVESFPAVATALFAGLAEYWAQTVWEDQIEPAPIQYFGCLPVHYALPDDLTQTILPAHFTATPTAA